MGGVVLLLQRSIIFNDLLLDFLGGVREVCRLVRVFGRLSLLLCGVLEAFAERPVIAAKVEGVAELNDVWVITECEVMAGLSISYA